MREATRLRKAGDLVAAREVAAREYAGNPDDPWAKLDMAWVIYDEAKLAVERTRDKTNAALQTVKGCVAEFVELGVAIPDLTYARFAGLLRKVDDTEGARELLRHVLPATSRDDDARRTMAWVLYDDVKSAINRAKRTAEHEAREVEKVRMVERDAASRIQRCLTEFLALDIPPPDAAYAQIVARLTFWSCESASAPFVRLVRACGIGGFPQEYFEPEERDGKHFDALVERVGRKLGKIAHSGNDVDLKEVALDFLEDVIDETTLLQPEWLTYRKALLLNDLGRREEARATLLPFLRQKQGEYWAWEALANIEAEDPEAAVAALCMARLKCPRPDFLVNVDEALAVHAAAIGDYSLARWAVDQACNTRQSKGWRVGASLQALHSSSWYADSPPLADDPVRTLERRAAPSSQLLYQHGPWYPASYLESFVTKRGSTRHALSVRMATEHVVLIAQDAVLAGLAPLTPGESLEVAGELRLEDLVVHAARLRPHGSSYDAVPAVFGVVDHVNRAKQVTSIYLPMDNVALLKHADFPTSAVLKPGQGVRVWVTVRARDERPMHKVHSFEVAPLVTCGWIDTWQGSVRHHPKGFGFLYDVFVPPHLVAECPEGVEVLLLAVRTKNEKKQQLGWKAIARLDYQGPGGSNLEASGTQH